MKRQGGEQFGYLREGEEDFRDKIDEGKKLRGKLGVRDILETKQER